jgi:hypothetical protein
MGDDESVMGGSLFEVDTRTMLDNPMASAKVARRHKKLSPRKGILPNPSGGVNTHLSRNVAYVIGIVPVVLSTYSASLWNERRNYMHGRVLPERKLNG